MLTNDYFNKIQKYYFTIPMLKNPSILLLKNKNSNKKLLLKNENSNKKLLLKNIVVKKYRCKKMHFCVVKKYRC